MVEISDSIVVKRLVRNLRYRLTYVKVFETFLEPLPGPAVVQILSSLIKAQQAAIMLLSSYLHGLGVDTQDLPLDQKLLDHASGRHDVRSRLRFVHYGLNRAVSWYKTQLMDRQMTQDPALRQLLLELGQIEAAKLWRLETVLDMLRIPLSPEQNDRRKAPYARRERAQGRHPYPAKIRGRPDWGDRPSTIWSDSPPSRRSD